MCEWIRLIFVCPKLWISPPLTLRTVRDWRQNVRTFFFSLPYENQFESWSIPKIQPLNVEHRWCTEISNSADENYYVTIHTFHSCRACYGRNMQIQCRQSAAMNTAEKNAQDNIKLITKCIEFRHKSFAFFLPFLPLFSTLMLSLTYLSDDLLPSLIIN